MIIDIVEFDEIIFTMKYLCDNNIKHKGLRDNDLQYFGLHNDIFYKSIEDDINPSKALKRVTEKIKQDLLSRDSFLQIVSRNAEFNEYEQLEQEWHIKVLTQYKYVLEFIENPPRQQITSNKILSRGEVFRIIENTVTDVTKNLKDDETIQYLNDALTSWKNNFIKGHPNILYKSFKYLVELDKTKAIDGKLVIIDKLKYPLLTMPLITELDDIASKFIYVMYEAFDGDVKHTQTICTSGSIMDKRTFKSKIEKEKLSKMLREIEDNIKLTINI